MRAEKALKRYKDETIRVVSVLDKALSGREYLVGDKCTFADLAFVPWASLIPYIFGDDVADLQLDKKYPAYTAWYKATSDRASVQKMFRDSQAAMAAAA
ncbi:Glutathione S-transferase 2 [Fusarium odoratissimum]|uniref:Glutathione S-transferase 2 n=5 Tax=Fusarium oxysporum species complex TaxID=171631 RepID=N1RS93_FUSC4|nr:Glutathione S-transferase 2 [Fusarium odoratissimum]ENH70225.1 Glutathione S-transferase 2 [Fusarium oxysporum f. sp. cubense race 1]